MKEITINFSLAHLRRETSNILNFGQFQLYRKLI